MPRPVKSIVEEALTPQRARKLWTANYYEALPIAPQAFEVGSLLPSMLYMARFGHRRGRGRFVETFGKDRHGDPQAPTIASVAEGLLSRPDSALEGFSDPAGKSVLGDLLLAWGLQLKPGQSGG